LVNPHSVKLPLAKRRPLRLLSDILPPLSPRRQRRLHLVKLHSPPPSSSLHWEHSPATEDFQVLLEILVALARRQAGFLHFLGSHPLSDSLPPTQRRLPLDRHL
jgi:hypothetical protein